MVETKKLEEVASRLNKESDSLNEIIQKIQNKLNSFNIGIEVWSGSFLYEDRSTNAKGGTTIEHALGYAKISDAWCIAVQEKEVLYDRKSGDWDRVGETLVGSPQPLLKTSRTIRIAALQSLQGLILKVQGEAEKAIQAIEDARRLADEL